MQVSGDALHAGLNPDEALLADWRERALALERELGRALIGQDRVIRRVTTAVFARGHVLLQGDVGGETTLLRAFAHVLGGSFARAEGTIDLMPNDLIYYTYISAEGRPAVEPGPLIGQARIWRSSSSTRSTGRGRRCTPCGCG